MDRRNRWGASAVAFFSLALPSAAGAVTGYAIGDDAPDFTLLDQNGVERTLLGDYVGNDRLTILDFCAFWCAPCQQATEDIAPFVDQLALEGIDVDYVQLLVEDATFQPADVADAQAWSAGLGNDGPVLTGADTATQFLGYVTEVGSSAFPLFAYLDPAGVIFDQHVGWTADRLFQAAYLYDSNLNGFPQAASSATLTLEIGGEQNTGLALPDMSPTTLSGSIPGLTIVGYWELDPSELNANRRERWNLYFDTDTAYPLDQPVRFEIGSVDWADAVGGPDPGRDYDRDLWIGEATLTPLDSDFLPLGGVFVTVTFDGTTFSTDPILLADAISPVFPPGSVDVASLEIRGLTVKANAIPVPEPGARVALAAGGMLLAALRRRGRFAASRRR